MKTHNRHHSKWIPALAALGVLLLLCKWAHAGAVSKLLPTPGFPQSIGMVAFFLPPDPAEFRMFLDTGVQVWRSDFRWSWFETKKGEYDFSFSDKAIDRLKGTGVRALYIMYGCNELYPGFPPEGEANIPRSPEQQAGFVKWAAAAAKHFHGRTVIFELGNEPDGSGQPSVQQYMAWAKVTVEAMRKADPDVVIVGPAAHEWARGWMDQLFQLGFLDLVDAVSIHFYLGGAHKDPQRIPESHEKEQRISTMRELIAKYSKGRQIPLIDSEWGYKRYDTLKSQEDDDMQVTPEDQARYLARSYLLTVLWGVRFHTWFAWWLPTATNGGYCVQTENHTPMPAYYALKNLTAQLPNSTLKRRIDVGSPDDYVLEFKTAKGIRWAAWTCGSPHTITFPLGTAKKVTVNDLFGVRKWDIPVTAGKLSIDIDGAVKYVRENG